MAKKRKYQLANTENRKNVDLRQYKSDICDIIETTVPKKHPRVYSDHFTTDPLTTSEAIRIGRALSKHKGLAQFGMHVTTFRLFEGHEIL